MIKRLVEKVQTLFGRRGRAQRARQVPVAEHGIPRDSVPRSALRVCETLHKAGHHAYVVGGAVRDLLIGVTPKDFDVATDATPESIKPLFRRAIIIGRRFRLVHVMFGAETIEVSTYRAAANGAQAVDEHGRMLADNVFGSQADDAARRDFTINALYYDPLTETVIDYHDGVKDMKRRRLRMIGDPEARYREDPVRMLRAVRIAAKLGFEIDEATRAPISRLAPLLENVPPARVFDEMLKLLTSGHSVACITRLRAEGLHHGLLPLLDVILEQPEGERFVMLALSRTDERVRAGKHIAVGFLFACLLWHEVLKRWKELEAAGQHRIPALDAAIDEVLDRQTEKLAIQRRFVADMRDIWMMQPRFERRTGRAPYSLLGHLRLRAGYDFLALRGAAEEAAAELVAWWHDFMHEDEAGRARLLAAAHAPRQGEGTRRRRRRSRSGKSPAAAAGDATAT
jgi:poly(A) polymerase